MSTEAVNECKSREFLKMIYGNDIPQSLVEDRRPCGSVVYSLGEPDIKKLIRMTLTLMR